ncbi:hypothetical protein CF5_0031 [Staphylococcus phage CF5]|uniref:Uncharacterized protein n=1 Tax=Staphylococcus phage CF5 TaxID=3113739 RepID=A0AAX4J703_9CAUD|nr:hypothetical protein CF5_0031 [Staphylococcus phage CF5]
MYIIYEVIEELSENDLEYQYVRGKTLGYTKDKEVAEYYKNNYEDKYGNTCNYDSINGGELTIKELQEQMDYYTTTWYFNIKRFNGYFKLSSIECSSNLLLHDINKKDNLTSGDNIDIDKYSKNLLNFKVTKYSDNEIKTDVIYSIENYYQSVLTTALRVLKENGVKDTKTVIKTLGKIK